MEQLYSRASLIRPLDTTIPWSIRYQLLGLLATGRKRAHGAWLSLLLLVLSTLPYQSYADSGLYKDAVLLQVGTATSPAYYYTLPASAGNTYQNASLGSFARGAGARLRLAGGEANTYQRDGVTVQAAQLRYRLYLTGTTPGLFSSLDLPYLAAGRDGDAGNRAWAQTAAGIDLLAIAAQPGSYVLEVYFQAQGKYNGQSLSNFDNRSGANYQATFTVTAPLPLNNPSDNRERNWTMERSFDGNGQEVAASKQFTDALGRATQAQARNAATQQVFAAQTVYSTGGQPVLQTMAAPIDNQGFNYKENFITAGGQPYGPGNFENGLASNPSPVDATRGTVGYYYSQLNEAEPLTPITSYPYSLMEPYDGPMGGTRRAAGPGDELRMGRGREAKGRDFPLRKEFDGYLALRPKFVPGSPVASLEYQGVKSVSINADGRESIVVANKDGQAIISCLSGPQYAALPVEGYISAEGPSNPYDANAPAYQDIHLPAAGAQEVRFTMNPSYTGGGRVLVVNLLTSDTTSYAIKPATAGAAPERRITLTPGFYRFVSVTGTQRAFYEARYGDFSYTYYDDAGRVIATVAPNGLGGSNLLANPGLEQDLVSTAPPSGWQAFTNRLSATYSQQGTSAAPAHSGQFYGMHRTTEPGGHSVYTCQVIKNLPNGLYTARAWVQNSAITQNWPNQVASLLAKEYDNTGAQRGADLPITGSAGNWVQVQITDIPVTNGQCMLGLYSISPTAEWIAFDDVELVRQVDTSAPTTFTTRNTYDASSRLLATESTDEGRSEYVYAQDGRIRFSQSALQRPTGRFSYSNYDEVGRVVESGEYTPGSLKFENHLTASPAANSVLQPSLLEDRTRSGGLALASCAQRNQVWYDLPFDGTDGSQGNDGQLGGRRQEFVVGAVARTRNDNVTTWYSYDELGRVTWVVQEVAGVGIKTLDYTYDFSGNVLEVAYQKNQADAFYHYYTYDPAQRLTAVYTGTDGTTQTLQALYSYYLHGPLKRVQLAGNLQGIDYTYTLQGALKAINHVNQTLEPGHDAPAANGVYKDLFALTLDYFSGDYRSRAINTPLPIAGGVAVPTRYDGTIQGAAWRTGASAGIHRVAYTYDEKSQLQNSQYGKWDWQKNSSSYLLNPASANALQEGNLRYDANGNIQSLRRTDQAGNVADDFSYGYKPNTNQLKEVHTGSAAGPTVLDYDYDELGQLIRQRDEKGESYLSYDVTGKTTGFYTDAGHKTPIVTFAYDDRGFRVSKTTYANGVARQTTTYVRDVAGNILTVYEQPAPGAAAQRAEVPLYGASRLGSLTHLNDGTAAGLDDYRYELNDHLGDARVVFHRPTTTVDVETMELSGVPGRAAFLNDDRYRVAVSGAPSGDYVARLTDSQPAGQELKRVLSVSKGDTITFSALAQWKQNAAAGGNSTTPFILAGAAAGLAPLSQRGPEGQTAYQTNSPNWLSLLAAGLGFTLGGGNQSASLGSSSLTGWLKYRVLDESGTEQASGRDYLLGTGKWEYLQTGVRIAQAGTIEVMAGTSGSGEAVYFDNLRVEQSGGLIVQEQHQYAYGAPLPGLSYVVGSKRYRYGYQGQYAERDDETGFESFELRLYNSRVGRWLSYDPEGQHDSPYIGMGNNPIINIDPDGGLDGPWGIAAKLHPLAEVTVSGARQGMSTLARLGLQAGSSILRTGEWYGQYTKGFYQGAGAGLHDTGSWAVGLLPGTSRHSWKETGQGFSTLATLSNPYSADGMIMRAQLAASGANYIKNVPNMNPEDFGYDMGYTSEKVAEIWISHKAIPVLKSKIGLPTLGISSKYFSPISKMLKDGPMGKVRIPRVYTPVMRGGRLIMSNNLGTATGKWTTMGVRLVLWPSAGQYLPQSSKGVSGSW